jgi:hypothetical protein
MSVINTIVTICIGLLLVWGAATTYRHNVAERKFVQNAASAAMSDMANANASLPKWDDTNYKGLVYRPGKGPASTNRP